jgi:hypothetical protein
MPDEPLDIPPPPPPAPAPDAGVDVPEDPSVSIDEAPPAPAEGDGEASPAEAASPAEKEPTQAETLAALRQMQADLEIKTLEIERTQARLEHARMQRDKLAGAAGGRRPAPPAQAPPPDLGETGAPNAEIEDLRFQLNSIRAEAVDRAIREEVQTFYGALGDPEKPGSITADDVRPHVQRLRDDPDYRDAIESGDAKLARSAIRALLREAKAETQLDRARAAAARRVETSTSLRNLKSTVASPGSPTAASPAPRRELTQNEIDARLKAMVRSGQIR